MAMTSDESPETVARRPRGIVAVLRALVRQAAAAVYIAIIYGFVTHKLWRHSYIWLIEPVLVLLASMVVGFVIEGPWWTYTWVGFFVGLLDGLVVMVIQGQGGGWRGLVSLAVPLAINTSVWAGGGLLGRLLGKRRQSV